jgi:hypothetical protein
MPEWPKVAAGEWWIYFAAKVESMTHLSGRIRTVILRNVLQRASSRSSGSIISLIQLGMFKETFDVYHNHSLWNSYEPSFPATYNFFCIDHGRRIDYCFTFISYIPCMFSPIFTQMPEEFRSMRWYALWILGQDNTRPPYPVGAHRVDREEALKLLGPLSGSDSEALAAVVHFAKNPGDCNPEIAIRQLDWAARADRIEALECLRDIAQSRISTSLRDLAIHSLGKASHTGSKQAAEILWEMTATSSTRKLRCMAIRALGLARHADRAETVRMLTEMARLHEEAKVRSAAHDALSTQAYHGQSDAIWALKDIACSHEDYGVQRVVRHEVRRSLPPGATPAYTIRDGAVGALGNAGRRGQHEAVRALEAIAVDPCHDAAIRRSAAIALEGVACLAGHPAGVASATAARSLARVARATGDHEYLQLAREILRRLGMDV